MAAKPDASAMPAGCQPRWPGWTESTMSPSTVAAVVRVATRLSGSSVGRTESSSVLSSFGPADRSTAYHSRVVAMCATTCRTVQSISGIFSSQSRSRVMVRNLVQARADCRRLDPSIGSFWPEVPVGVPAGLDALGFAGHLRVLRRVRQVTFAAIGQVPLGHFQQRLDRVGPLVEGGVRVADP